MFRLSLGQSLFDHSRQLHVSGHIAGLLEVRGSAKTLDGGEVGRGIGGGKNDYRNCRAPPAFPNPFKNPGAMDLGEIQVEKHQRYAGGFRIAFEKFQESERFGAIRQDVKLIGKTAPAEDLVDQERIRLIVFDQQDGNRRLTRFAGPGWRSRRSNPVRGRIFRARSGLRNVQQCAGRWRGRLHCRDNARGCAVV